MFEASKIRDKSGTFSLRWKLVSHDLLFSSERSIKKGKWNKCMLPWNTLLKINLKYVWPDFNSLRPKSFTYKKFQKSRFQKPLCLARPSLHFKVLFSKETQEINWVEQ